MANRGKIIVFEGPDGGGKSSVVKEIMENLRKNNHKVISYHEPGSTVIGEKIRDILLDPNSIKMTPISELFLYMAARNQLVEEFLLPNLNDGYIIIMERFLLSSIVYQGIAGGIGEDVVENIGNIACRGIKPDITILLDVDVKVGLGRIKGALDRIEQKDIEFHKKVREGYLAYAKRFPDEFKIVDATLPQASVFQQVLRIVDDVL